MVIKDDHEKEIKQSAKLWFGKDFYNKVLEPKEPVGYASYASIELDNKIVPCAKMYADKKTYSEEEEKMKSTKVLDKVYLSFSDSDFNSIVGSQDALKDIYKVSGLTSIYRCKEGSSEILILGFSMDGLVDYKELCGRVMNSLGLTK